MSKTFLRLPPNMHTCARKCVFFGAKQEALANTPPFTALFESAIIVLFGVLFFTFCFDFLSLIQFCFSREMYLFISFILKHTDKPQLR